MALTATATPDVLIELKQLLGGNPICEISTVNKANITYHVHEIKPQGTCSWHTSHMYRITIYVFLSQVCQWQNFIVFFLMYV